MRHNENLAIWRDPGTDPSDPKQWPPWVSGPEARAMQVSRYRRVAVGLLCAVASLVLVVIAKWCM